MWALSTSAKRAVNDHHQSLTAGMVNAVHAHLNPLNTILIHPPFKIELTQAQTQGDGRYHLQTDGR